MQTSLDDRSLKGIEFHFFNALVSYYLLLPLPLKLALKICGILRGEYKVCLFQIHLDSYLKRLCHASLSLESDD